MSEQMSANMCRSAAARAMVARSFPLSPCQMYMPILCASRAAVGAAPGQTEINIAGNSASSSLLPMLKSHSDAAPQSAIVGRTPTDVIPLDSVFDLYYREGRRVFLKIDTQGYERPVLEGAT